MAAQEQSPTPSTPTPQQPPPPQAPAQPAPPQEPVFARPEDQAGLRALNAERDARAQAERELKAERTRREELERAQESELERYKREAEEGRTVAVTATKAIQENRTLTALTSKGMIGPKAQAAYRLLDGLEFDSDLNPVNLDARLEAAKAVYGPEIFTVEAPPTPTPSPAPTPTPTATPTPTVANGARPVDPAAEEEEQFKTYMNRNFPGLLPEPARTP